MLIRQGKPIHKVTLIMDLIEQGQMNISLVRLFYFDDKDKMIYKTERNYPLGEVLHVLYEHDLELERAGFKECGFEGAEKDGSTGVSNSRIWRHRWFYELAKLARTPEASSN